MGINDSQMISKYYSTMNSEQQCSVIANLELFFLPFYSDENCLLVLAGKKHCTSDNNTTTCREMPSEVNKTKMTYFPCMKTNDE